MTTTKYNTRDYEHYLDYRRCPHCDAHVVAALTEPVDKSNGYEIERAAIILETASGDEPLEELWRARPGPWPTVSAWWMAKPLSRIHPDDRGHARYREHRCHERQRVFLDVPDHEQAARDQHEGVRAS